MILYGSIPEMLHDPFWAARDSHLTVTCALLCEKHCIDWALEMLLVSSTLLGAHLLGEAVTARYPCSSIRAFSLHSGVRKRNVALPVLHAVLCVFVTQQLLASRTGFIAENALLLLFFGLDLAAWTYVTRNVNEQRPPSPLKPLSPWRALTPRSPTLRPGDKSNLV